MEHNPTIQAQHYTTQRFHRTLQIAYSEGSSAAQMLLTDQRNILRMLKEAVRLFDPLVLLRVHISTCHFDPNLIYEGRQGVI